MKAKRTIPKKPELPESPLQIQDATQPLPTITQLEITDYSLARTRFQLAQADFERKRGALALKLLSCCPIEEGGLYASLDENSDRLVVIEERRGR